MFDNSTIVHPAHYQHENEFIQEPTAINIIESTNYDSIGASFFIVTVLLWYSIGVFGMLGIRIRARSDTIDDCAERRAKLFLHTLRDQTETKQILETLVDKENREKLWKIYFGKLNPGDYIKQAEQRRIKNIQKQLSIINRKQILLNDTTSTSTISKINLRRYSSCIETYSHTENRRRSSLDLQMIERWKSIADKTPNRPYKRSSSSNYSQFIPEAEKCHLLTRKVNPYVTYFHLPRPLVTIKSNHQIIQIDDDNQVLNFSKV